MPIYFTAFYRVAMSALTLAVWTFMFNTARETNEIMDGNAAFLASWITFAVVAAVDWIVRKLLNAFGAQSFLAQALQNFIARRSTRNSVSRIPDRS